jgi:hypothetical protein
MAAIRMRWELRNRPWFWMTIILVLLAQVPLILIIPFPRIIANRITLLPLGFANFLIIVGAIRLVEKIIVKAPPADEEE